jgi:hypothetical protein
VVKRTFHRPKAIIALGGVVLAVCLMFLLGSPPGVKANTYYCNNQTLGSYGRCDGAPRWLYATYGWGDQHSVCVLATTYPGGGAYGGYTCSGGPGQGTLTYVTDGTAFYLYPAIANHAAGSNTVHGSAQQY